MRIPTFSNANVLTSHSQQRGVTPSDCPRGWRGALCRSRCGACRAACRSAQAGAVAACAGLSGPAFAACTAAAVVAGNECYNGCC